MRRQNAWLLGLIACCLSTQAQTPAVFPPVTGYNLAKEKVTLPGGMAGKTDLLLISFAPEQQKSIDSWLPAAQALQHSNFQFRYYELPVSPKENFVFRWWETSSMRSEHNDPEIWPWIVPLFVDRQSLLAALEIPNEKHAVVLLVDQQGRVLWRTEGPMTPEKRASLMAAASAQP